MAAPVQAAACRELRTSYLLWANGGAGAGAYYADRDLYAVAEGPSETRAYESRT